MSGPGAPTTLPEHSIVEYTPQAFKELSAIDLSRPFVVKCAPWLTQMQADTDFLGELNSFNFKYDNSEFRRVNLRGQQKVENAKVANDISTAVADMFHDSFKSSMPIGGLNCESGVGPELKRLMLPSVFGIAENAGSVHVGPDLSSSACFRGTLSGFRLVALVSYSRSLHHLAPVVGDQRDTSSVAPIQVYRFWKEITQDQLADFVNKNANELQFKTVGPTDVLLVPAGFIVMESLLNGADTKGIRVGLLPKGAPSDLGKIRDSVEACHTMTNVPVIKNKALAELYEYYVAAVAAALATPIGNGGGNAGDANAAAPAGGAATATAVPVAQVG